MSNVERVLMLIALFGKLQLGIHEIALLYDAVLVAPSAGSVIDGHLAAGTGPAELAVQAIVWAARRGPVPEWIRQAGVTLS